MSLPLTAAAELASRGRVIEPNLVLKISGYSTIFGGVSILKYIQIGDTGLLIGTDWVIGGLNGVEDQESLIDLGGTGTKIQQQLRQDQGSVAGVSSMTVQLVDQGMLVSELISPGVELTDVLGRRAEIFMGFADTAYPDDYVRIFAGIIDDVVSGAGFVQLNVAHPDQKKRQTLFTKKTAATSASMTDSQNTVPIATASSIFDVAVNGPDGAPDSTILYYVQIDDEIIQYTGASATELTGAVRAQHSTLAPTHPT